jgi:colanic acid/amylovoran biosynthesis glycosyltransferase
MISRRQARIVPRPSRCLAQLPGGAREGASAAHAYLFHGVKLAVIISQFPCSDEVFILRELRALQRGGVEIQIFSLRPASEGRALHAEAASLLGATHYSPFLWSWAVVARNLQLLLTRPALYGRLLARVLGETWRSRAFLARSLVLFPLAVRWGMELRAAPVDRIHAHWATHPSTAAWIMSRVSGIPFSMTAHAHDIYLDQAMLPFKLRASVAVLTCTHENLDFLRNLVPDLPDGRLRLSYHGVDLAAYRPAAAPAEVFRILSVGTLLPRKGFDTLLEACALLQREGTVYACEIVGDGPIRDDLERRARWLGLGSVTFLGKRSQEELPEIYRRASVFVLAANHGAGGAASETARKRPGAANLIHFGIPNVILEAMASGLPVVASGLPALKEVLVEDGNGLGVPERDPAALAAALRALARDPARRARLGAHAAARVRAGFDLERTAGEVARALGTELDRQLDVATRA